MATSDTAVERVRAGDSGALAAAFDRHRARLRRTVEFRMSEQLRGRLDPDDILQDAFLSAGTRHTHVRGNDQTSLFVWLRLVVLQTLTDAQRHHLQAQKRDARREANGRVQGIDGTSVSLLRELAGGRTSPSFALARVESAARLRSALSGMNALDREVLALRHFEELANHEVAATLNITPKTASIRYIRALRRLKDLIADPASDNAAATSGRCPRERA